MTGSAKVARVSRDQWLAKAMELFAKAGEQGVRVEVLAREIGVAKSGFYWHFKDRKDLLDHLLNYWAHEYTEVVTSNPEVVKLPAKERVLTIMNMVQSHDLARYDVHFRAWAKKDPVVARKVRQVVKKRLDFMRQAFAELGFTGDDLEMRARLFVAYESNERSMFGTANKKGVQRLRELRWRLLLSK